jgi:AraC family transcriptional regulator, regulatory protein of adaptative response / methylated-DNA-[protein]-cysteine methyltransferase
MPTSTDHLLRTTIDTPLGSMTAVASEAAMHLLEFETRRALTGEMRQVERDFGRIESGTNAVLDLVRKQLADYFAGYSAAFNIPTLQHGSELEEDVWKALKQIPPGQTRSYGDIADMIGQSDKSREVGQANGANKISIIVPCHRVIGSDGSLVGYGGGLWRKKWLLDHERQYAWKAFESR